MNITGKTGSLIAIKAVKDQDDLMIINNSGLIIRMAVADLRVMGRATQGVRLINLRDNDKIAAVAKVDVVSNGDEEEVDSKDLNENIENNEKNGDETDAKTSE
jgi:DNA gyrase subunit A